LRVNRLTKSREALGETCNPFDVTSPYCVGKVVQLNRQRSTHTCLGEDCHRRKAWAILGLLGWRAMPVSQNLTVRFGPFQLETQYGELRKGGIRLKLQGQPIEILEMLLAKPGELVTREDIQQRLWPADTFVDFDHSLNTAVKKLRQALGDEADAPRYIETLPKRGYRFIGQVETEAPQESRPAHLGAVVAPLGAAANPRTPRTSRQHWVLAGCLATLFVAGGLIYLGKPPSLPRITGSHPVATNIHTTLAVPETKLLTDGESVYFQTLQGSAFSTFQVPVTGGAVSEIPAVNGSLNDISRDGSELLFEVPDRSKFDHASVLAQPLPAGPARLILKDGREPIWSSDGRFIFFTRNDHKELDRADADGTGVQQIPTSTDIFSPQLSPDGSLIRFSTGINSAGSNAELWEVGTDGSNLHPILAAQKVAFGGAWSPDGKVYFFSGWDGERFSLWTAPARPSWWQKSPAVAQPLTSGPDSYGWPTISRDGRQLFAMGEEHQGELSVYDGKSEKFVPYLGGISVCYVDFSRDGQWMAYVSYPEGSLWRSKIDGSEKRQLTSPPTAVMNPRWSPDGKLIVFTDRSGGDRHRMNDTTPTRIYVVSGDGGAPSLLLAGDSNLGDPTWSPDGNSIAYASSAGPNQSEVSILDIQTQKSTALPGSKGLWSPRWSPDGKYLVALVSDLADSGANRIMLFTFATQTWQELASAEGLGWESWSRNSNFVYAMAGDSLVRIEVSSHKRENVASLVGFRSTAYLEDRWDIGWFGLSPDDRPVTTRDAGVEAIYAFDLDYK
jgi:Tol biopolymer transport system component/DNA-binding winged helix-turn-helix (wHTH) protein